MNHPPEKSRHPDDEAKAVAAPADRGISRWKLALGAASLFFFVVGVKRSFRTDDGQEILQSDADLLDEERDNLKLSTRKDAAPAKGRVASIRPRPATKPETGSRSAGKAEAASRPARKTGSSSRPARKAEESSRASTRTQRESEDDLKSRTGRPRRREPDSGEHRRR